MVVYVMTEAEQQLAKIIWDDIYVKVQHWRYEEENGWRDSRETNHKIIKGSIGTLNFQCADAPFGMLRK